ncbi:MAG: AAA family ATPase [Eggerthellaceae bacterium]|nr:AAA family ATPase [Eggerthellaceae bacterium]
MAYMSPLQAAEKWGITQQRVTELCRSGAVRGAWREGRRWRIPENAQKPTGATSSFAIAHAHISLDPPKYNPVPIGYSAYDRVANGFTIVDKSLLIKQVLDSGAQVTMFLRPRRFGKTLNMNMLCRFFEKTEEDASALFKDRLIWGAGERYTREQGKYPCVYITLKDARGISWEWALAGLKSVMRAEFIRHSELAESPVLDGREKAYIASIIDFSLPDPLWPYTLSELMRLLHKHHGMPAMFFIDEYDSPIQVAYLRGYYDEMIEFMRPFISVAVKDNPHLHRGFFSGITRVAKESIFSGLNNVEVDSMLEGAYAPFFGYTYEETYDLLGQFDRANMFEETKRWYDGYRINGIELFNPWSINNYIARGFEPWDYWQQTGSSEIIRQIVAAADPDILDQISALMNGDQIEVEIDDGVAYPQVEGNPRIVFSFLLMAGYLRIDERIAPGLQERSRICKVSIPNFEIRQAYAREAIGGQPSRPTESAAEKIRMALLKGDAGELEENLGRYVREVVSYHDAVGEAFYHGMVVGLCAAAEGAYRVSSNRESGLGRYDVQLAPKYESVPGVVIEVKAAADAAADLQALADAATRQILEKDSARELMAAGAREIITVGLAFRGKDVAVATLSSSV